MNSALRSHFFYTAPGIRLHAKVAGPVGAPVLLMVHGFPEFWFTWRHQMRAFSSTYRCVAIDLRGFHLSSQPQAVAAYRPRELLADLCSVIAQLGTPVEAVIAHDWGGALCWSLAALHPQLMRRLVILNAPHTVPFAKALAFDPVQQAAGQYMNRLRQPDAEPWLAANDFAALREMLGPLQLSDEERAQYTACWRLGLRGGCNLYRASPLHPDTPESPGAMQTLAEQIRPDDFRVAVPTQVIWGLADPALRPVLLEGLGEWVPHLQIHTLPDAGHWIAHSHADEVNRVIDQFLHTPLASPPSPETPP